MPPCCRYRAVASIEDPKASESRIMRAALLFSHIDRQILCPWASETFSSSLRRGASGSRSSWLEAIPVVPRLRDGRALVEITYTINRMHIYTQTRGSKLVKFLLDPIRKNEKTWAGGFGQPNEIHRTVIGPYLTVPRDKSCPAQGSPL